MSSVDVLYDRYLIWYEIECKEKKEIPHCPNNSKIKYQNRYPIKRKVGFSVKLFDFVRIILSLNMVSIVVTINRFTIQITS